MKRVTRDAKTRADQYRDDPERLRDLAEKAARKAKRRGPIGALYEDLMRLLRMIKAYATGAYREIPWQSIVVGVGAVGYFVSPIDLIPDAIPIVGLLDDATVLGFAFQAMRADLEAFAEWEAEQTK